MTKADKTRQLNLEQENAIDLLIQGMTDKEVAAAVGVSRQTVTTWRNQNAEFAAELNSRRQEVWGSHEDKLRQLIANAVNVLAEDLADEDRTLRQRAAVHVLRAVGLYGASLSPAGPTSSQAIQNTWNKQEREEALDSLF